MFHDPVLVQGVADRSRLISSLAALFVLVCAIAMTVTAFAHHPGSHAKRLNGAAVWLDAAVVVNDGCTTIKAIEPGAPQGSNHARDAQPFRIVLQRPAEAVCAQVVTVARMRREVFVTRAHLFLHLFVLAPDGKIASTERVRVE